MAAPLNTVAPAITGDAVVGGVLSVSDGTWTGGVDGYAYQWLRNGGPIDGATTNTYTVTGSDITATLTANVTAANGDGATTATAAPAGPVPSTLIVEDGTGLADADSYLSLAGADAYHGALGNGSWATAAAAEREAALRRATQYLDTRYRWRGEPLTDTQALAWPRTAAAWPVKRLQDATAELALRAAEQGSLYADEGTAAVKSETVGPISVTYADAQRGQTRFTVVEDLLSGLIANASRMSMRVERAS
jgi:hypothetical protein